MIIVGHRGARKELPENTVEGFVYAQSKGIEYFELDIQLSRDNQLVVIHDSTLKRTTGVRRKVRDLTRLQLSELDARRNTPGFTFPCAVPSLEDVVLASPHVNHWQFEVKTDSHQRLMIVAEEVTNLINKYKLRNRVTITSSDRWYLRYMQENHPGYSTGYVAEHRLPFPVESAVKLGCSHLIPYYRLCSEALVSKAKSAGLHVSPWTVNKIEDIQALKDMGVDSVITDYPTKMIKLFPPILERS